MFSPNSPIRQKIIIFLVFFLTTFLLFAFYFQKKYIGRLPDDIAHRIIWLHGRDNKYRAYIKSVEKNMVKVFLREIKCSNRNKDIQSFSPSPMAHVE